MRIALVVALMYGLVPGFGEVAETLVHYAVEGRLAHSDADQGDLGHEHGCSGSQHLCGCCASQVFVAQPTSFTQIELLSQETSSIDGWRLVSLHDPAPPRRPPIAS